MFVHVSVNVELVVDLAHYRISGRWLDDPQEGPVVLEKGGTVRVDPYAAPLSVLRAVLDDAGPDRGAGVVGGL